MFPSEFGADGPARAAFSLPVRDRALLGDFDSRKRRHLPSRKEPGKERPVQDCGGVNPEAL